jgi:hypothetical protein
LSCLVGQCWAGRFTTTGQLDTHCYEPNYGGAHVRDRHEVTGKGDVYRGESIYSWNPQEKAVEYVYVNSVGGVSRGRMTAKPDRLDFGGEEHLRADGSRVTYSTFWRRVGDDAYEAVTTQPDSPTGETVVRYRKLGPVEPAGDR